MSKSKKTSIQKELSKEFPSTSKSKSEGINYLKQDSLSLKNIKLRKIIPRDIVPPQSPNSEFEFHETFKSIPSFPQLDTLDIPYVREKGVKYCIDHFGKFFNCSDFTKNYLQFWFLDIITDCVWSLQDEYYLPEHLQKLVLKWFLYFLDLIRNQKLNLSRKGFFSIFKDAILIAAEVIDEGCVEVPPPEKVFQLIDDKESSEVNSTDLTSSVSSVVISRNDCESTSFLEIQNEDETCRFELFHEPCVCDEYDLSTLPSLTESDSKFSKDDYSLFINEEGSIDDDLSFYKPDLDIPSRFLKSSDENEEGENENNETEITSCKFVQNSDPADFEIYEVDEKYQIETESYVPSESSSRTLKDSLENEFVKKENKKEMKTLTDQDILKALAVQKMWEQRLLDMSDPRKGWIPSTSGTDVNSEEEELVRNISQTDEDVEIDDEWVEMVLKGDSEKIQQYEDNVVLNFGVLWAIIEIIFKYFYESFQFSLIKMAFQATPEIICQKLNTEWYTMKINKVNVDKPKYVFKLPPRVPPEKKAPATKEKPPAAPKKVAPEPAKKIPDQPKLSPQEQKALLEQQRLEEFRLREELRIMEENKKYLFPLMEGVTDDFFREIFPNWEKVKEKQSKK